MIDLHGKSEYLQVQDPRDTEELNYLSDEIYEIYDGEITGHIEHPDEKVS